ncbi:MAG: hypothetical protein GXY54_05945 [Deltaproteobacteria bacterium]|nr:hypothetical protein [Deltaproteobacteria bacterium]
MGEFVFGILIMGLCIGYVLWRNKKGASPQGRDKNPEEQRWWAEREAEKPKIVSAQAGGDDNDSTRGGDDVD